MVDGEPDFPLRVKDASEVAPRHGKAGLCLYGLEVARLDSHPNQSKFGRDKDGNKYGIENWGGGQKKKK